MGENSKHSLSDNFRKPRGLTPQIEKELQGPDFGEFHKLRRERVIREMAQKSLSFRYGAFDINREENVVTIKWTILASKKPEYISVTGHAGEIGFIADPDNINLGNIVSTHGSGSIRLELEEGCCYYFEFRLWDTDGLGKYDAPKADKMSLVTFDVGIPLSAEKQLFLRKSFKSKKYQREIVSHELRTFFDVEEDIDEMCQQVIAQIKAKNLPEAEEQDKIQRFIEKAESLKNEFGV